MSELQWKKRDFSTGAISFDSHDYVSNSNLWIKDVSFSAMLVDSGAYCCYTIDRR